MRKLLVCLMITGFLSLLFIGFSCVGPPDYPIQLNYRDGVPDSIYLRQADIEHIAELVKYRQLEIEYKRDFNNLLLKIAGTLIMLLLGGLMWFLRQMLVSIPKLQSDVNKLSTVIAASEQWNKDQKEFCHDKHADIDRRLNILEK